MKKFLALIFAVALTATVFTACKKDYTCTCTDPTGTTVWPLNGVKKSTAQTSCDNLNAQEVTIGGSCTLN